MTWAPDAIWDPAREKYMVFWTSKINGVLKTLRAWTRDFDEFTPAEVYVELGMDNTIVYDDEAEKYYMVSKNGPDELIQQNVADTLDGPWEMVAERIGRGMPAGEGPLVFRDNVDRGKVMFLGVDRDSLRGTEG